MGLAWKFADDNAYSVMWDTRLPFGARKSPAIFNRLTQAVVRMMIRSGEPYVTVYLDDFFVCGPDFRSCKATLDALISLLRSLGFQINWSKVVDPCQRLCFLGVIIDTTAGVLSLKDDKTEVLLRIIQSFQTRKRASRRKLE